MMGPTLTRYLFLRHATTTLWFLLGVGALVFLIDFTEFSRMTSSLPRYSVVAALGLSAMRLPFVLQQVLPFVGLFSAMTTLIALNRRYELVVARSTGVSAWQFLLPIGLSAFAFGVVAVLVLNPLGAWGIQRASMTEAIWKSGASNATTASDLPWMRQKVDGITTIIGAHGVLANGADLRDVTFYRVGPDERISERIDARRAVLAGKEWRLENVKRRAANGDVTEQDAMAIPTNLDASTVGERIARPEMIAFPELLTKIRAARAFGYPVRALATQFQMLLALPMLLVAMSLIAATASLRFVRFGQSLMLVLGGIVAGFLLYVVMVLAKAFGSAGVVAPVAAAWFPVLAAISYGAIYLLYREDG